MEYVEHGDLRGYLEKFGEQSEESAKEIAMQVLEGLVILHGRSICYRDLKPEVNLLPCDVLLLASHIILSGILEYPFVFTLSDSHKTCGLRNLKKYGRHAINH
jgi:serine/threonine protein kinase